jgi:O-antigen ligase
MRRVTTAADWILVAALLAYLAWVPMPFGSTPDFAQMPLVLPPLLIAAAALLLRRRPAAPLPNAARWWLMGAVLFITVVALQLLPLPDGVLRAVSPQSARLWSDATRVASLAGVAAAGRHPVTLDPSATTVALFRLTAYAATFIAAMLLLRGGVRRNAVAATIAATATFETIYAVREASLGRYAIWGWKNTLIFGRPTGTFVNPNHFAHYCAIALPAALYLCAAAWHRAGTPAMSLARRVALLVERRFVLFAAGALTALACAAGIIVSQSRGALLAAVGGIAITGGLAAGRRHLITRVASIAVALAAVFVILMAAFGRPETAARIDTASTLSSGGRAAAALTAFRIARLFPILGCGLGTFEDVALMVQPGDAASVINHAHNDYLEVIATAGIAGFIVSVIPLLAGYIALVRATFGARAEEISWRRRAFQTAALASLSIALVHALVDFNFFIPANPVTLAAIAGAAVSLREH